MDPVIPFPPELIASPQDLAALRALIQARAWDAAEREWLRMIRGFCGHSKEERMQRAAAYQGYADFLEALGRTSEAQRMISRSRTLLQDRSLLETKAIRRERTYSFMKEIRQDEGFNPGRAAEVRHRLEMQWARQEKWSRRLWFCGAGFFGLLMGTAVASQAVVGALVGFALAGLAKSLHWGPYQS